MEINKELIDGLFEQAQVNPRLRQNYDLRTSERDHSQRMLNALLPGTVVPIHRHPQSTENVFLLCGKLVEVVYDNEGNETDRILLDPTAGSYGCVVPQGAWHTVEVLEPSVIFEAKDGKFGEDGSETLDAFRAKEAESKKQASPTTEPFSNSLGDLKKNGGHYTALRLAHAECATGGCGEGDGGDGNMILTTGIIKVKNVYPNKKVRHTMR